VDLGAKLVHFTNNVGHSSLVAQKGGEVARLGGVITRERSDSSTVGSRPLPWEESQRASTGGSELTVRHACVGSKNDANS
jgi:hypothetical protein